MECRLVIEYLLMILSRFSADDRFWKYMLMAVSENISWWSFLRISADDCFWKSITKIGRAPGFFFARQIKKVPFLRKKKALEFTIEKWLCPALGFIFSSLIQYMMLFDFFMVWTNQIGRAAKQYDNIFIFPPVFAFVLINSYYTVMFVFRLFFISFREAFAKKQDMLW